jgi:hypothetical protein
VRGAVFVDEPRVAVMVTGVEDVTAVVFTVNVALVAPAATVTLEGTVAAAALLERLTTAPLLGAGPLSVTVPLEEEPPVTLLGLRVIEERVGDVPAGVTVSVAVFVVVPRVAVMVTGVEAVTAVVFTVNVALVAPAATVTLAGTVAADALLERDTTAPLLGAGPLRVTVPVEEEPPVTLLGLSVIEESVGGVPAGVTVSVAVFADVPKVAVIVAEVEEVTVLLLTVNVALVAPEATVTLEGTVAAGISLERDTAVPP